MLVDAPGDATSTTSTTRGLGGFGHRQRAQPVAIAARALLAQDRLEPGQVGVGVDAEVVRVPPQVIERAPLRRAAHAGDHARKAPLVEQPRPQRRAQEAAGGDVAQPARLAHALPRDHVGARERHERVGQPRQPLVRPLRRERARPIHPAARVSAVAGEAGVEDRARVVGVELVARQHQRAQLHAAQRRRAHRRVEVGAKLRARLARLEAVVVRERVRRQLLARRLADALDQRRGVVQRIGPLVGADRLAVRRQPRVGVARLLVGVERAQLVAVAREQHADGGPGRRHVPAREQLEQPRDRRARAQQVRAVAAARGLEVAHAPVQLEVERDDQSAGVQRPHKQAPFFAAVKVTRERAHATNTPTLGPPRRMTTRNALALWLTLCVLLGASSLVLDGLGLALMAGIAVAAPSLWLCSRLDRPGLSLMAIFLVALALRWGVCAGINYLVYETRPGLFAPDEIRYDYSGWMYCLYLEGKIPHPWDGGAVTGVIRLTGVSYYLLGHNVMVPKMIIGVLGAWSAALTALMAARLFPAAVARRAGWLAAVFPSLVLWSSVLMKDTTSLVGAQLALLGFLMISERFSLPALVLLFLGVGVISYERPYEIIFVA